MSTPRMAVLALRFESAALVSMGASPANFDAQEYLTDTHLCVLDEAEQAVISLRRDDITLGHEAWFVHVIGGPTTAWRGLMRAVRAHFVSVGKGRVDLLWPERMGQQRTAISRETAILESTPVEIHGKAWRRHEAASDELPVRRR